MYARLSSAFLLVLLMAASAVAQDSVDIQQLSPMPNQSDDYFGVSSARMHGSGQWGTGLFVNYADDPLIARDENGDRLASVVSNQLTTHVLGSVGIADRLELGLDIPLILLQGGESIDNAVVDASSVSAGLGDIRFVAKALIVGNPQGYGFGLAGVLDARLPTSRQGDFQGESFRAEPRLVLDYGFESGARFGGNLGFLIREETDVENLDVNDTFTWGLASAVPLDSQGVAYLVPEVAGEVSISTDTLNSEEAPMELLMGVKVFPMPDLLVQFGGGAGIVNGYGVPDFRLFFGLNYARRGAGDRDGDGILNPDDACPDVPEDPDFFEDRDGCPDEDNDRDGIPDMLDGAPDGSGFGACREQAEDPDGFEDQDGCPDPDNDFDRVPDSIDGPPGPTGYGSCMNAPEDRDSFEDQDGCPDEDNDGDGVPDVSDGVVDASGFGSCLNSPEDLDGFQDDDGCPDEDNDGDGFLDVEDGPIDASGFGECRNRPEDFDNDADDDGCPEETEEPEFVLVELTCDRIQIFDRIYFDTNSDVIQPRSYGLLDEVAALLFASPYITLVRIEGHTDDQGSADYNLELSDRRAASVRSYLVDVGVDGERLISVGYGEMNPIDTNETSDGRANNRRVEFIIAEQDNPCRD